MWAGELCKTLSHSSVSSGGTGMHSAGLPHFRGMNNRKSRNITEMKKPENLRKSRKVFGLRKCGKPWKCGKPCAGAIEPPPPPHTPLVANALSPHEGMPANCTSFVAGRLIDCSALKKSLEVAYDEYLPKHTHPFVYLSLFIKPDRLDVNVHPTKKEVCCMSSTPWHSLLF